jgi:preprotein translocase subunit SecA
MDAEEIAQTIVDIREDVVNGIVQQYVPPQSFEDHWNIPGLMQALEQELGMRLPIDAWLKEDSSLHEETLRARVLAEVEAAYKGKEAAAGEGVLRHFEKAVMLRVLDQHWKEHLAAMDYLRQGIHLRGYAQKNPKQEYKREAFEMFRQLLENIKRDVVGILSRVQVRTEAEVEAMEESRRRVAPVQYTHAEAASALSGATGENAEPPADAGAEGEAPRQVASVAPFVRGGPKVGRNDPCPCGSGKKFKQCHGRIG